MLVSHRIARFSVPCLLVIAGLLVPAPAVAQEECSAYVSANLDNQEEDGEVTRLQFVVEVESSSNCAHIKYDLVIQELMVNGETKEVRKPRDVKLDNGSLEEYVRHEMSSSVSLQGYEAKVVKCTPCDIMP